MIPGIVASRMKLASGGTAQNLAFVSSGSPPSSDISADGRTWTSGPNASQLWNKSKGNMARTSTAAGLYFEVLVQTINAGGTALGLALAGASTSSDAGGSGNAGNGGRYQYFDSGRKRSWGSYSTYASSYTSGDRIGVSVQTVSGAAKIHFYKNGVDLDEAFSESASSSWEPHFCSYANAPANVCQLMFPEAMLYLPPGFTPWA